MKKNEQSTKAENINHPEKMSNNVTELVFIIDKSGSMSGLESDTIGGFNAMIETQKKEEGDAYVSTVLFNNYSEVIHDRVHLQSVEPLVESQYRVSGCTALLDAIGDAIHHIGNVHKYARREDVPEKTIFLITTDGMENASRRYSSDKVKEMIRQREQEHGWEFIFVAANIDAVETAERIGIHRDHAANYRHDSEGTERLYRAMGDAVSCCRKSRSIDKNWSKSLE